MCRVQTRQSLTNVAGLNEPVPYQFLIRMNLVRSLFTLLSLAAVGHHFLHLAFKPERKTPHGMVQFVCHRRCQPKLLEMRFECGKVAVSNEANTNLIAFVSREFDYLLGPGACGSNEVSSIYSSRVQICLPSKNLEDIGESPISSLDLEQLVTRRLVVGPPRNDVEFHDLSCTAVNETLFYIKSPTLQERRDVILKVIAFRHLWKVNCTHNNGYSNTRWERVPSLTLTTAISYHSEHKLARRCSKHPGPWRHLMGQVMRIDCTTRRPAPDRRRVFPISGNVKGGSKWLEPPIG